MDQIKLNAKQAHLFHAAIEAAWWAGRDDRDGRSVASVALLEGTEAAKAWAEEEAARLERLASESRFPGVTERLNAEAAGLRKSAAELPAPTD